MLCERVWKPVQHAIEESRKYCIAYLGEYRLFTVIYLHPSLCHSASHNIYYVPSRFVEGYVSLQLHLQNMFGFPLSYKYGLPVLAPHLSLSRNKIMNFETGERYKTIRHC